MRPNTGTPSQTNIQDISPQEQSSQLPSGEPKRTVCSKKRGTGVQAACVVQKTYWNHEMTTVNRYLPFISVLCLFILKHKQMSLHY